MQKHNDIPALIKKIKTKRIPCLFLSPHLDDAVMSCGALIKYLSAHTKVTVATIFTEYSKPPYTLSAKIFLNQRGFNNIEKLYQKRKEEDVNILSRLHTEIIHVGLIDALFRKKFRPSKFIKFASLLFPEFQHIYPTYKLHISKGSISRYDNYLIKKTTKKIQEIIKKNPKTIIFCPLGIGNNVDHLIIRELSEKYFKNVIYYADFPYLVNHKKDKNFIKRNNLTEIKWKNGILEKKKLIYGYKVEARAIFPNNKIPKISESYFLPNSYI